MTREKSLIALIAFLAGIGTFLGAVVIFDIDLVKWVNCSAPFAPPDEKRSQICDR
jgi:hypothetical protein